MKYIFSWRTLSKWELEGRQNFPLEVEASIHIDAAEVGFWETLNKKDLRKYVEGPIKSRVIWDWNDRAQSIITVRELKEIRMMIMGNIGRFLAEEGRREILFKV